MRGDPAKLGRALMPLTEAKEVEWEDALGLLPEAKK